MTNGDVVPIHNYKFLYRSEVPKAAVFVSDHLSLTGAQEVTGT